MSEDLRAKVLTWLTSEGFPFELRAGRSLRDSGWKVDHGVLYEDPLTKKVRELDIRARYTTGDSRGAVTVTLAIACKSSHGHPWVAFTSESSNLDIIEFLRVPGSMAGHAVLYAASEGESSLPLFQRVARVAHGVTKALRTDRRSGGDASGPYATALAALSAATALSHAGERFVEQHAPNKGIVEIPIPIVLLDGVLFDFYLSDAGEATIAETPSVLLSVPEPFMGGEPCYVLLVQYGVWKETAKDLFEHAEKFAQRCLPHAERVVREHMDHLAGARKRRGEVAT